MVLFVKAPHHLAYTDWGDAQNPHVVICVHGLTRNCRDFDYLAQALQSDCRVISVDVVGRGQERLVRACTWLWLLPALPFRRDGFSGSYSGAIPIKDYVGLGGYFDGRIDRNDSSDTTESAFTINKLVLSDIGPLIPAVALKRIADYVGKDPRFSSFEEFKQYMKMISASFGPLTEDQNHMAIHSACEYADGSFGFRYDPRIAVSFLKIVKSRILIYGRNG